MTDTTPRMPTCPRCSTNDRVIALTPPEQRPGRPLVEAESSWPFECEACTLVFTGTDDEFVRMYRAREKYRDQHKGADR